MKVLILAAYAFPERVASSHLTKDRNEAFARNDISVTISVPTPCRGLSETEIEKYKKIPVETLENGFVQICRFRMFKEGKNPIIRALRYSLCWLKQFFIGLRTNDYDVLLIGSTPPIQGLLGAYIGKLQHKPFVFMLQDIFPDSLVGTGLAKKDGILWKIGNAISDYIYKHADKIIVISEEFKRNIIAKGVPENKIEVIYNWVDTQAVYPVEKEKNPLYDEFGIDRNRFTVVYAGNLGNAQNLGVILSAASAVPDVQFLIFGSGGIENEIRSRIETENLGNVRLLPLQPYEKVSYVYGLGDACIVSCKAGLGGSAMPSKTWTIMACGRPVIANFDEGELKNIIETAECGVFTHADDVEELVEAISALRDNQLKCRDMGHNSRRFVLNNLTKEVGTQKYVDVITSVIANGIK